MRPQGNRLPESPTERIEREEFARGHLEPGESPADPRPAATVGVARAASDSGFEALLLRRPQSARFAAGAYVFPGGVVDAADADPRVASRLPGSLPAEARPALAAALRELLEETGFLPSDRGVDPVRREEARRALLEGRSDFAETLESLDVGFRELPVAQFSRWITPPRLRRRYDTRFFLAALPDAGHPDLTPEHTGHLWEAPGTALRRFRRGELPMLFPTWKTLETLAGFVDLDAALRALRSRPVETVRPRLRVAGGRVSPLMPGDPGYEDAALEERPEP